MELALIALSILCTCLLVGLFSAAKRIKIISEGFSQLFIRYNAMKEMLDLKTETYKTEDEIHKENFIKFLSDSREWAFGYIEEVQKGLKKFIEEVEPQLKYYDKYGVVVEGFNSPHDFTLKKISKEFENLKKLLPEDSSDRR